MIVDCDAFIWLNEKLEARKITKLRIWNTCWNDCISVLCVEREKKKTVENLMEKPQLSVAKKIRRKVEDENGPFSSWAFRQVKQFSFCLRRTVMQYDNLIVIFLHEKFISNSSYRINYPTHTQRIETEKSKVYLIPSISTRFIKSCYHFMFQFLEISETNISIRSLACTKTKVTIW